MKSILMSLCVAASLAFSMPLMAQAEDDPTQVVKSTVDEIVAVLKARKDSTKLSEADREAISAAVADKFDYRKMARGSIGRPWQELAEADKVAFSKSFRELLERSYGNRLAGYRDQEIRYADAEMKEKTATVKSWVIDGEKEIPVFYRLYLSDDGWKVFDIKIEGVSLVGTYRNQFKALLEKDGFPALLTDIQAKVQNMKDHDAAA